MKLREELYNSIINDEELTNKWQYVMNQKKKHNIMNLKRSLIICVIIDILIITLIFKDMWVSYIYETFLILIIVDICLLGFMFNTRNNSFVWNSMYKKDIIEKIIGNFYDDLEYFPEKGMPKGIYDEVNYERYNKYHSDDYFEAKIDNKYDIDMAEIITQKQETYRDSEGNTNTETTTMFHGLFAKIVMDKSINSNLEIVGNSILSKYLYTKNKLEMDSAEFEKYFDVYSTNQIIGMQILTADIMQELIDFRKKSNIAYEVFISNNNIYLRFHCGVMFEPASLKNGIVDQKTFNRYFDITEFTYDLANKLINAIEQTEI